MIQCISCDKFSFRDAGKMAELGFGLCAKYKQKHRYKSATYQRECMAFNKVSGETEQARREWLAKK